MTEPDPRWREKIEHALRMFDPEALRAQVGQRITINGPRQITGVLASAEVADDGLSVKLRIETEHG